MIILRKLKNKKDILETIAFENLTNIVIETGNENVYIPGKNKFIVTDSFLAISPNLFYTHWNLPLETIDFSNFDFSKIKTMRGWFHNLRRLKNVIFPDLVNANKLESFTSCFSGTKIKSLDFSNWILDSSVDFTELCENNKSIQNLILPNCQIDSIRAMVNGCINLKTIDFNNSKFTFNYKNNFPFTEYSFCLNACNNLLVIDCSKMDISEEALKKIFNKEIDYSVPEDLIVLLP